MICWILGHKYFVVKIFSKEHRKLQCYRCKKQFGMHDSTQSLFPWDAELEDAEKAGMFDD